LVTPEASSLEFDKPRIINRRREASVNFAEKTYPQGIM